jgi:hypothetical protein
VTSNARSNRRRTLARPKVCKPSPIVPPPQPKTFICNCAPPNGPQPQNCNLYHLATDPYAAYASNIHCDATWNNGTMAAGHSYTIQNMIEFRPKWRIEIGANPALATVKATFADSTTLTRIASHPTP